MTNTFIAYNITWREAKGNLPDIVLVRLPSYVLDLGDDDEIDEWFQELITKQTGGEPVAFGYFPCDDIDRFETEEQFWEYARALAHSCMKPRSGKAA